MSEPKDTGSQPDGSVQPEGRTRKAATEEATPAQHHELKVVPIEEEAIQDDVHINLSWRSWVRSLPCCADVHAANRPSLLSLWSSSPALR